jgi:hypothetical protein
MDSAHSNLASRSDPSTGEERPAQIGRYRILETIGAGGMGTVYKAQDPQLNRLVAVKVPHFDGHEPVQASRRQRFQREARAAAQVCHPHVCPVYDVGEQDGQPFVVMAYVEGISLSAYLQRQARYEDVGQAVALIRQALDGLDTIHARGIIHRDLKPGNIMLDRAGNAILMDFGLSRVLNESDHLTSDGVVVGTPAYMAPEQAAGPAHQVGPPTDLYSLAVVLYKMLTGRLPFEGPPLTVLHRIVHDDPPPPSQFRPDLPAAVEAAILRALRKTPSERFPDARAFAEALAPVPGTAAAAPTKPPAPAGATTRPATHPGARRWAPSRALGWLAGGVLVAAGAVLVCVWLSRALSAEMFAKEQPIGHRGYLIPILGTSCVGLGAVWVGTLVWQLIESLFTPEGLLFWARYGHAWEVKRAVLAGVPLDSRDDEGETALMRAAAKGHTEVVKLLLLHGANPELRNPFGQTALDLAQSTGRADTAAVLRQCCSTIGVTVPPSEPVWRPRPLLALVLFSFLGSLAAGIWWKHEIADPRSRGDFLAMSAIWPGDWVLLPLVAVPAVLFGMIFGPLLRLSAIYPMLVPRVLRFTEEPSQGAAADRGRVTTSGSSRSSSGPGS